MTNKELIKKCVGIVPGWEMDENKIVVDISSDLSFTIDLEYGQTADITNREWENIYYPLLLQQAMYGVNRLWRADKTNYFIIISSSSVKVWERSDNFPIKIFNYSDYPSETEALAEALKFYFEEVE